MKPTQTIHIVIACVSVIALGTVNQSIAAVSCGDPACGSIIPNPMCPPEGAPGDGDEPHCETRSGCLNTPAPTGYYTCDPQVRIDGDGGGADCVVAKRINPETLEIERCLAHTEWKFVYKQARAYEVGVCYYTDDVPACCADQGTTAYCKVTIAPETLWGSCISLRNDCVWGIIA